MNSEFEQLKERNRENTDILNKPYQPVVYAIPEEQWSAMLRLMNEIVGWQPKLSETLDELATDKSLSNSVRTISQSVMSASSSSSYSMQALSERMKELERLAGKIRDESSRSWSNLQDTDASRFRRMQSRLLLSLLLSQGFSAALLLFALFFLRCTSRLPL